MQSTLSRTHTQNVLFPFLYFVKDSFFQNIIAKHGVDKQIDAKESGSPTHHLNLKFSQCTTYETPPAVTKAFLYFYVLPFLQFFTRL